MELTLYLLLTTLLFIILFIILKWKYPQTLWLGFSFISSFISFGLTLFVYFINHDFNQILIALALIFAITLLTMPFLTISTLLYNGVKLIRAEGFRFTNILSLGAGIATIIYFIFWPTVSEVDSIHILNTVYQIVSFSIFYISAILILFTLTSLLNLIHIKHKVVDYFIVLGAGLNGQEVTPLLAGRINKAVEKWQKQGSGKLVFSGGQGPDEEVPEGYAMAKYALENDVPEAAILREMESTNTNENILYSYKLIKKDWQKERQPQIAIVSNNYHVLRALMQASKQGLNTIAYGSKSKFYFSLNAFIREFIGYLEMTKTIHITVILTFSLITLSLYLFLSYHGLN